MNILKRMYEHGDVFWLLWMVISIIFMLTAPYYLSWIGGIAAIYFYDMAMFK